MPSSCPSCFFLGLDPSKQVSQTRSKMWMEKDIFQNNQNIDSKKEVFALTVRKQVQKEVEDKSLKANMTIGLFISDV